MAETTVTGLTIAPCGELQSGDDSEPASPLELQAHEVIRRLRQGQPKAALASAVDLVNDLCAEHGLNGSAQL